MNFNLKKIPVIFTQEQQLITLNFLKLQATSLYFCFIHSHLMLFLFTCPTLKGFICYNTNFPKSLMIGKQ